MAEEKKDLQVIVKESGLDSTKAKVLLDNFKDYFDLAAEWELKVKELVVTDETQVEEMAQAREGRLELRQKRLAVENTRKNLKEQSLREGKAIDGIANVLKALIVPLEEHLDKQEHFVEYRRKAEDEAMALEAEKLLKEKEEREAKEREAEQERIRVENEKLRKKNEALEAKRKKEKAVADAKLQAEREAREQEVEAERALAREREEELKAKGERERKAQQKKDEARRKKEAEAYEEKMAEAYEEKLADAKLQADMVICPECGHEFSYDPDEGGR